MKKYLIYTVIIFIVTSLLYLQACTKDDISQNLESKSYYFSSDLQMLVFKDENSLFVVADSLSQLPPESRILADSKDFKSLTINYNEFLSILNNVANEEDYQNLLIQYADIIDTINFRLNVFNKYLAPVLNRNGMVKVGKSIYLFTDKSQVTSPEGNIRDLENYLVNRQVTNNVEVHHYTKNELRIKTICGHDPSASVEYGSRKMIVQGWIMTTILYNGQYRTVVYFNAVPYKKNWRRRWVNYRTINYLNIENVTVRLFSGLQKSFSYNYSNNWNHIDYTGFVAQDKYKQELEGNFITVRVKASSRGTGSHKAEIDCDNGLRIIHLK